MTDETTMPASSPAEQHTQPAEHTPAQDYEQPAATPEHYEEHFQDEPAEEPADLGEILKRAGRKSYPARNGLNFSGNTLRTNSRPANSGLPSLSGTSANAITDERQSREPSVRPKPSASGMRLMPQRVKGGERHHLGL